MFRLYLANWETAKTTEQRSGMTGAVTQENYTQKASASSPGSLVGTSHSHCPVIVIQSHLLLFLKIRIVGSRGSTIRTSAIMISGIPYLVSPP